jgi:hypothetical protein
MPMIVECLQGEMAGITCFCYFDFRGFLGRLLKSFIDWLVFDLHYFKG